MTGILTGDVDGEELKVYCAKCGKEISDSNGYCPYCGTKSGKAIDSQQITSQVMQRLSTVSPKYYLAMLCQMISIFLIGSSMFQISAELFTSYTYEMTMFEGKETWKILFIIGYLVAALAMTPPIFVAGRWKHWNFVPGMVVPIFALIWMFSVLVVSLNSVDLGAYKEFADALDISASLTANAWFFMLISAGGAAFSYLSMNELMHNSNAGKRIQPNRKAKARVVGVASVPMWKVKNGRNIQLTFEMVDGSKLTLFEKSEYQAQLGDEGVLTWNDDMVVFFEREDT